MTEKPLGLLTLLRPVARMLAAAAPLSALWLSAAACGPAGAARPAVAATVPPLAWLARRLAAPELDVVLLLPPGARPESFEPSPGRWADALRARVAVAAGHPALHFETEQLDRLRAALPGLVVVTPPLPAGAGEDPHVWTSPAVMRALARRLAGALGEAFPALAPLLPDRLRATLAAIDGAERALEDAARAAPSRAFVTLHAAWGHLAGPLGLEEIAVDLGERPAGPYALARAIDRARQRGATVVIAQPQLPRRPAELIAEATSARLAVADPLADDWPAAWRAFAAAIEGRGR